MLSLDMTYEPLKLKNQTINRWLLCGPFEQKMTFEPVTMSGEINTWLLEGFSIHENPCRKEYVAERRVEPPNYPFQRRMPQPGEAIEQYGQHHSWSIYSPWGNPRIDQSGFWFVPTQLVSYAATQLKYERAQRSTFRLRTCGAVTLWVNGELIIDFVSYQRNKVQQIEFELDVKQGINLFEVRLEDLAERDTEYYFQLDDCGAECPTILLPTGTVDAEYWLAMERALEASYFERETVVDADIVLMLTNPHNEKVTVDVSWGNFFDGVQTKQVTLQPNDHRLILGHTEEIGIGYHYFSLDFWLNGLKMSKRVGLEAYLTSDHSWPSAEVAQRKQAALRCIADYGSRNIHTAIAMLQVNGYSEDVERIIREGIARIHAREDCSDFYLVGLFKLWKEYRSSNVSRNGFTDDFWEQVKACILSFRYWIDEPGDDVMWFFSENHALLFHVCELLAGQYFPDDWFSNSDRSGEQHRKLAEARLEEWFERFFQEGLAEWNSNAYIPIDAVGLLHIYDLAESDKLRQYASQAMDQLFYYIAVHAHEGRMISTFGRSYEKELKGHHVAGTTSMCWIAYGKGNLNAYSVSNVIFSLSQYEPPEAYAEYLEPSEKGFVFQYEQGAGGYARLYHYKTKDAVLSSIQDFRPGFAGYQEHVIHYAATPFAQAWINHPGELHGFGSGRPSFWAGNGTLPKVAQYRGLAVMLYRLNPNHDAEYTHLYLPIDEFDEWTKNDSWLFARKADAYIAVWAANGMRMTEHGANRRREWISEGLTNTWIMRASNKKESGSFTAFIQQVHSMGIELLPDQAICLNDPLYGKAQLSWEQPWSVNNGVQSVAGAGVYGRMDRLL